MRLETSALERAQKDYHDNGWHVLGQRLDADVLADVRDSVTRISRMVRPEVVYEDGTSVVRALHGCHRFDDVCERLVRQPSLVALAKALTGDEVYVYQFKVNIKSAYEGQEWPWHQDFAFWSIEDGMPTDNAVNIAIALDEVHDLNGPLTVLSGSHRLGLIEPPEQADDDGHAPEATNDDGEDWRAHVSAKLTHTVDERQAKELMADHPPVKLLGPRGTITAFHPSIVHSSSNNLSADRRAMLFITYNAVRNAPPRPTRPEFLVDRDTTPIRTTP